MSVVEYDAWLSTVANAVNGPLQTLSARLNLPLLTALLLGLIGATSPRQITTNLAALAYIGHAGGGPRTAVGRTLASALGKARIDARVGLLVIGPGLERQRQSIPVVVVARKALGPVMVLLGLLRPRFSVGGRLSRWLEQPAADRGALGAFLPGVAFALASAPTFPAFRRTACPARLALDRRRGVPGALRARHDAAAPRIDDAVWPWHRQPETARDGPAPRPVRKPGGRCRPRPGRPQRYTRPPAAAGA